MPLDDRTVDTEVMWLVSGHLHSGWWMGSSNIILRKVWSGQKLQHTLNKTHYVTGVCEKRSWQSKTCQHKVWSSHTHYLIMVRYPIEQGSQTNLWSTNTERFWFYHPCTMCMLTTHVQLKSTLNLKISHS